MCLMKSYFGLYYFSQIDMATVTRIVLNTPRPNENGRRFANDIFKCNFLLMKIYEFRFHWCLFLMDQLTIFLGWFLWWLGSNQETSHYLNQWWLDSWRIRASLGLNELTWLKWFVLPFPTDAIFILYNYEECKQRVLCHRNKLPMRWFSVCILEKNHQVLKMFYCIEIMVLVAMSKMSCI